MENNETKQLGVNISPDVAKGTYSNLAIISHSKNEFVVDFAAMLPGMPKAEVQSRIIMNPENAKRLFLAIQDNIIKFENQFGTILLDEQKKSKGGTFNFEDFGPIGGNS